jgi:hypothetical protein
MDKIPVDFSSITRLFQKDRARPGQMELLAANRWIPFAGSAPGQPAKDIFIRQEAPVRSQRPATPALGSAAKAYVR